MLTLALLRHAKSSWADPGLDDFDRPLNARGETAAPRIGAALASAGFRPDLILCSPSKRTRETLERASPRFGGLATRIIFDDRLYLASGAELLRVVQEAGDSAASILVIGHNPGLHAFALSLAGEADAADLARLTEKFPTAALAILIFEAATWAEVRAGGGRLEAFVTPKNLA